MAFRYKAMILVVLLVMAGLTTLVLAAPRPTDPPGPSRLSTPPEPPAGPEQTLSGRVVSGEGPVAQARVRVAGQAAMALSQPDGHFSLSTPLPERWFSRPMVTAGKEGWFNNGVPLGWAGGVSEIGLYPLYLNDQPDYRFYSPLVCFNCHGKVTRIWDQSKMAHTTSNPKLLEMYYGNQEERRAGKGLAYRLEVKNSEGNCAQCHAPGAAANPVRSRDLEKILTSPLTEWDGVSCDYCHKTRKVLPDPTSPSGARSVLERQYPATGRSILIFGPYDDVVTPPMAASYSPFFDQGQFCSACHAHYAPTAGGKPWAVDKVYSPQERQGLGLPDPKVLPVQTTYQEWKAWQDGLAAGDPDKGKRCQFCHMSWTKRLLPYDNFVIDGMARNMLGGTYRSPNDIRPHHFEGGTKEQLASSLGLELAGEVRGKTLVIKALVSNTNGGHWVPTGEPMRNVLLLVKAADMSGKPLKLLQGPRLPDWAGQGDPAHGDYAGLPGFAFARVLADDAGHLNVPFWRATRIASDTRLRPKRTETLEFVFALDDPSGEPSAEASLVYRPVVRPWAKAKHWKVDDITITSKAW